MSENAQPQEFLARDRFDQGAFVCGAAAFPPDNWRVVWSKRHG